MVEGCQRRADALGDGDIERVGGTNCEIEAAEECLGGFHVGCGDFDASGCACGPVGGGYRGSSQGTTAGAAGDGAMG